MVSTAVEFHEFAENGRDSKRVLVAFDGPDVLVGDAALPKLHQVVRGIRASQEQHLQLAWLPCADP